MHCTALHCIDIRAVVDNRGRFSIKYVRTVHTESGTEGDGKVGKVSITRLARVIRSKNAGPYELTLDIIFNDAETYRRVKAKRLINKALIAGLYHIPEEQVLTLVEFDPANAVKATIVRPRPCGDVGETDVYGAQQHAPLLELELPWDG